jgi:hypothetical protein
MPDEDAHNAVLFWQRLIEWWKENGDAPVPERMHLALRFAEAQRDDTNENPIPKRVLH